MFFFTLLLVALIHPQSITSIDDYVTTTAAGKAPILPRTVVCNGIQFDTATASAKGNNNFDFGETFNSKLVAVVWDAVSSSLYGTDKVNTKFTVNGVVQYEGRNYTAKAVVTVNTPLPAPTSNTAVTFENIHINDVFWAPKQKVNAVNSLNAAIYRIGLSSGGEPNFDNAIKRLNGESYSKFSGWVFQDSDIYKTLEAISYTLLVINDDSSMADQRSTLEKVAERWLGKIEQVQYADGYVDTFFALRSTSYDGGDGPATHRFRYLADHELYVHGHFFEAAVAYTRYREGIGKPDYRLYVVAKRAADNIVRLFGPGGKRHEVPGHEVVELGLVKVAKLVQEYEGVGTGQKYIDTAKLLIDRRGESRSLRESNYKGNEYSQDHVAFSQQTNVVGHSVRAGYLYSGAADIVSLLSESNSDRAAYLSTLDVISDRVINRNTYITGGVGIASRSEGFGDDYELPNNASYCEICAAIAMAMWFQRMNLIHKDTKYADSMERVLYNGVLVGSNLNGDLFYYSTLLEVSNGNARSQWFSCACCPPNYMRTISSLGGYMYTVHANDVYVNLFVGSTGRLNVNGTTVVVKQDTSYPWDGEVNITVTPNATKVFTINVRIPGWIKSQKNQTVSVRVNGNSVSTSSLVKGYVAINRTWASGDVIAIVFPMEVRLTQPNANVKTNAGRVAIERGPIVYCMETAGNGELNNKGTSFNPLEYIIPSNAVFTVTYKSGLLKGVMELTADVYHTDRSTAAKLQAIPYYAWNNRGNNGTEGQNSGTRMLIWTNSFTRSSRSLVKLSDVSLEDFLEDE